MFDEHAGRYVDPDRFPGPGDLADRPGVPYGVRGNQRDLSGDRGRPPVEPMDVGFDRYGAPPTVGGNQSGPNRGDNRYGGVWVDSENLSAC